MTKRKWVKCENDKIVAGVCAGLARYLGSDINLTRVAVFFAMLASGSVIFWAYIVAIIILPKEECAEIKVAKTWVKCSNNKIFGGVSSGFANYIGADVGLVRIIFFIGIFLTGGALFWTYIAAIIMLPEGECLEKAIEN
ncbi:MAG: PspC domain-containing protein [Candidatus Heimdallarchaeaceae archaeon]|jgi:phage shock protein PspC (stress-responsive transcriptional regulator)